MPPKKSTPAKTENVKSSAEDIKNNKALAAVAYLWIFCLVPLLAKKDSPYAQFHAKQGTVVAIAWFLLWIINVVPLLGQIIFVLGMIPLTAVNVMAIIKAWNGEEWKIPYLHDYVNLLNL